ncbi:MAG TPA: M1 family metallopeptidase [Terriglobales bacterium]|nr:M1 family metallopeptidase [Terriglobales bacterium]
MSKSVVFVLSFLLLSPAFAQRLPDTVVPAHYELTFTPDLKAAKFAGQETIRVHVARPASTVTLDALEMEFHEVTITQAGKTQKAGVTLDPKGETATFSVGNALEPGPAEIHIRYTGILNGQLRGFYLSKGKGRNYATTQMEPTDARRAFPSFDEPALKATFAITLVVDEGDTAISNGRIVSDTPGPAAGKHTLRFSTTPRMSTYLVAMAVGDWKCSEGAAEGIPIRICSTPENARLTKYALVAAEQQVAYFNQYFGIRYPFEKLDVLAVPDFEAGAMENAGAIFYRESVLLADENTASAATKRAIASVLAHEIAHMWFGDLVTMKWWDDIWLNEGFASWATSKPLKVWKPEWKRDIQDVYSSGNALSLDSLANTRPIRRQAETREEINELFDGIAYSKTAAVLRMVESYLGEETFRRGVQAYLKKHSYANATAEDFWNTLAQESGKPVDAVMRSFVDQAGVPLLRVRATCEKQGGMVEAEQQRFFYDRQAFEKGSDSLWQVPLCLRGPGDAAPKCELMTRRKQSFMQEKCQPWVLANPAGSGYYRVAYDSESLRSLSHVMQTELSPGERLSLLNDQWALVRLGQQEIGDYLSFAEGLRDERTRVVMFTLTGRLDYIGDYLLNDATRPKYQAWVQRLLRPTAQKLGWQPRAGESDELRSLRAYVLMTLGRTGRDAEVRAEARKLAEQYLADPKSVDATLAETVLSLAALDGDAALYQKYLAKMESDVEPEEHERYQDALTYFTGPALVRRSLEYAVSGRMRNQDSPGFIRDLLELRETQSVAWDFVKANWPRVEAALTIGNARDVVRAVSTFCEVPARHDAETFFAAHPVPAAERTLRQALENANNCINLRATQQQSLAAWLAGRAEGAGR